MPTLRKSLLFIQNLSLSKKFHKKSPDDKSGDLRATKKGLLAAAPLRVFIELSRSLRCGPHIAGIAGAILAGPDADIRFVILTGRSVVRYIG